MASVADYQSQARRFARRYGLDPNIFVRQINQESGFRPHAVSPAGARGIAQFMPGTAAGLGVNPDHPTQALKAAAKLMADYVHKYGSYKNALVAYNAGPGRVGHSLPSETQHYIANILGGSNPSASAGKTGGAGSVPQTRTTTQTTSVTPDAQQAQRAALAQFVLSNRPDPLALAENYSALGQQTQTTTKVRTSGGTSSGPSVPSGAAGSFKGIFEKAASINAKHLPYQWGGGHGPTPAKPGVPLDCSGAVSEVLGVTPRVAAQFKGKHVTIWAARDGHHVLLEINGHFWGTSGTNPGGGAGWIPRAAISSQYLSGFVARHPPGL
jgi:hypothetical protein